MRTLYYGIKKFWKDEDGMGVVEVVLITIVLVGLVILFKSQILGREGGKGGPGRGNSICKDV